MITCIDVDKFAMKRDGDGSILVGTLSPGKASFSCAATSSYDVPAGFRFLPRLLSHSYQAKHRIACMMQCMKILRSCVPTSAAIHTESFHFTLRQPRGSLQTWEVEIMVGSMSNMYDVKHYDFFAIKPSGRNLFFPSLYIASPSAMNESYSLRLDLRRHALDRF